AAVAGPARRRRCLSRYLYGGAVRARRSLHRNRARLGHRFIRNHVGPGCTAWRAPCGLVIPGIRPRWPAIFAFGPVRGIHCRHGRGASGRTRMMTGRTIGYGLGVLLAAAGACCWSLGGALVRLTANVDAWQIIFYRSLTLLACMLPWLIAKHGTRLRQRVSEA